MIPLFRLEKLPPAQRLGKLAKIFSEAERRLLEAGALSLTEREYLRGAAALALALPEGPAGQAALGPAAREALEAERPVLTAPEPERQELRRGINRIRHLLLAAAGRQSADWDFDLPLSAGAGKVFAGMWVYLEDIRSPFNVGAMFRTAASFGVERLWLSPFCADPRHPRALRSAMGCVDALPWERSPLPPLLKEEEMEKMPVFALETHGTPVDQFPFPRRGLMVVGSEELGASPEALALAAASLGRVSIPTVGAKGSLNVSTAFGIAAYAWSAAQTRRARA